jgi:pseudouridine kinase
MRHAVKRCIVPSNHAMPTNLRSAYVALIGGANMDIAAHSTASILAGDSNPGRIACSPGGVARNVAENLLRLGVDAHLVSVLGDDVFGQALRQSAAAIGLNMSACATIPGQRTATYLSMHGADGDMGVAVNDMGIVECLTPELLGQHTALLDGAAALVVDSNVRQDVLLWISTYWADKAVFAEAVSVAKCHKLLPVLGQLHTLKANRLEAQALSGQPISSPQSACDAARSLHQRGVRNVVISLGASGVAWCNDEGAVGHKSVRPVSMASATGAGDALLSGLIYGYMHALPLDSSVQWAMACAELTLSSTFANSPDLCVATVRAHIEQNHD